VIDVSEGQQLPVLERKLDVADLMAYGAATWDWHPLHYDRDYVKKLGIDAPVVDGQMFGALLAKQLIDWLGPQAFISNLSLRYRSMVFAGEAVTCEGRVTTLDEGSIGVSQIVRVADRIAVEANAKVRLGGATPNEVPAKPVGSEWESRRESRK
jgi:acyl dehydratase